MRSNRGGRGVARAWSLLAWASGDSEGAADELAEGAGGWEEPVVGTRGAAEGAGVVPGVTVVLADSVWGGAVGWLVQALAGSTRSAAASALAQACAQGRVGTALQR